MKDVRSQLFFKDREVIVTTGKDGLAEVFKKTVLSNATITSPSLATQLGPVVVRESVVFVIPAN